MIPKSGVAAWRYSTTNREPRRRARPSITGRPNHRPEHLGCDPPGPPASQRPPCRPLYHSPGSRPARTRPALPPGWILGDGRLVEPLKARLDHPDEPFATRPRRVWGCSAIATAEHVSRRSSLGPILRTRLRSPRPTSEKPKPNLRRKSSDKGFHAGVRRLRRRERKRDSLLRVYAGAVAERQCAGRDQQRHRHSRRARCQTRSLGSGVSG